MDPRRRRVSRDQPTPVAMTISSATIAPVSSLRSAKPVDQPPLGTKSLALLRCYLTSSFACNNAGALIDAGALCSRRMSLPAWPPGLDTPCEHAHLLVNLRLRRAILAASVLQLRLLLLQGLSSVSSRSRIPKDWDLVKTLLLQCDRPPNSDVPHLARSLLLPSPSPRDVVVTAQLLHLLPERNSFASWCCLLGFSGCSRQTRQRALVEPPSCGIFFVSGF